MNEQRNDARKELTDLLKVIAIVATGIYAVLSTNVAVSKIETTLLSVDKTLTRLDNTISNQEIQVASLNARVSVLESVHNGINAINAAK